MRKLIAWCKDHVLFVATLFLLAFIPLYPKLPVLDVSHTWVYVRAEDFVVVGVLALWGFLLVRKKVTLATPLTVPMLLFFLAGLIATIHGILLVLPVLGQSAANVAFLSYLRRIEYMSVFFVSFWAMREKKLLTPLIVTLIATVLAVALYGLGQRYFSLPAYLTMNEEFAKGVAITLSPLSRVSATFGGHYDLAAWLVLTLPILASMLFAFRSVVGRAAIVVVIALAGIVLLYTVSRVSLAALLFSLGMVLLWQRKKLILLAIPAVIVACIGLIIVSPKIVERFASTLTATQVLVDAQTGAAIGASTDVPNTYFEDKTITQANHRTIADVYRESSPSVTFTVPYADIRPTVVLFREPNAPTGEDLPQGTGYVNLALAPVIKRVDSFIFEPTRNVDTQSGEVFIINGNYLVKQAHAYDLSFTTRFQGEWPRAIAAFKRNIFLGSGYGSVGLAVDNSYLRMLAEVGLAGLAAFVAIFIAIIASVRYALSRMQSPVERSFMIGVTAGITGLALNALLIDVFEASKVAFTLWLLAGCALGIAHSYDRRASLAWRGFLSIVTSPVAIVAFFVLVVAVLYGPMLSGMFVADDFTWLRWASVGKLDFVTISQYFTQAAGFFFRPGTKLYFLLMYNLVWLNQTVYHATSLALHLGVGILVFLLAKKLFKRMPLAAISAALFLVLSGIAESVVWVSATGHLFAALFMLGSLLSYIAWDEGRGIWAWVGALALFVLAMLFHEMAVVTPLLFVLYAYTLGNNRRIAWALFAPVPLYLAVRYLAGSHWMNGDYSYNLVKLPFNAAGNLMSYAGMSVFGTAVAPLFSSLRTLLREQLLLAAGIGAALLVLVAGAVRLFKKYVPAGERSVVAFSLGFFLIALLPFIGLGNASARYGYLAAVGVVLLLVWVGQKLYDVLLPSGRMIAALALAVAVGTFAFLQLVEHQQIREDWSTAGSITKNFATSIEANYHDSWSDGAIEFHFVNVPIRARDAWVFPVGLPDVLWLLFQNPQVKVYTWATVEDALAAVEYNSTYQYIFEFREDGVLIPHSKYRDNP